MKKQLLSSIILLLLFSSCAITNLSTVRECEYQLGSKEKQIHAIDDIILGNRSIRTIRQEEGLFGSARTLLSLVGGHKDFTLWGGVNIVITNPTNKPLTIKHLQARVYVDRNQDQRFTKSELLDLFLLPNTSSAQLLQSLPEIEANSKPNKSSFPPIIIPAKSTLLVPVMIGIPRLKEQLSDNALMSTLITSALKKDYSFVKLEINPYPWGIPFKWYEIDLRKIDL